MITRCNQCSAKFEISAELLQAEDTTVRCGECLSVFDARAQLVVDDVPGAYAGASEHSSGGAAVNAVQHSSGIVPGVAASSQSRSRYALPVDAEAGSVSNTMAEYAHISDEDLENAATVVLDETQAAGLSADVQSRPLPSGTRGNDGFYSPDLNVDGYDQHAMDADRYADVSGKIDPFIDPVNLDSTSLEFEHTLALEGVGSLVEPHNHKPTNRSVLPDDVHSADFSAKSDSVPHVLPGSDDPDHRFDTTADFAMPASQPNEAVLPDIALPGAEAGRGYPAIPDDMLSEPPPIQSVPVQNRSSEYSDADEDKADSASELRRYVNSRGGEVFPSSQQAPDESGQSGSFLLRLLAISLLIFGGLYATRNTIATMNLPAPVLGAFCSLTGCELPVQKDVAQLELVRHQMAAHPSLDKVLMISVDLINQAAFPQPYPVLVVTMANSEGQSVAFRKFQPEEYLEKEALLKTLPAGKPVRIKFEIVDPGPEAMSSELNFE